MANWCFKCARKPYVGCDESCPIFGKFFEEVAEDYFKMQGEVERKPQTNADRIRAMSDEELARFIYAATSACSGYECEGCPIGEENCMELGKWLKQPVKDGEDE